MFETPGLITIPKRYRNEHGQLMEHAPYYHRDIHPPTELRTHRDRGEHIVKVRVRDGYQTYVIDYHPFDVVGWDGYVYPWTFSIHDFEPITGRIHMPPPSHQTFAGPNFVICSFCPRKLDFDPEAIPIPYHHSNLQSEEMIYYVDGNFSSRKGIEVGSVTLHPSGLPHGPQPGLAEKSLGHDRDARVRGDVRHVQSAAADDARRRPRRRQVHVLVGRGPVDRTAARPTTTPPASPRTSRVQLVLDWDGTCTVRDSLVAAVHALGDPRSTTAAPGAFGSYGEALAAEVATMRVTAEEAAEWAVENVELRAGLPRARRALPAGDRLERPAAADPAGARARGRRARGALERRRASAGRLARAFRDEGLCPVCGDQCKRRSLPAGARSSSSATAGRTAARRSPADRVFARTASPTTSTSRAFPYEPFETLHDVAAALS